MGGFCLFFPTFLLFLILFSCFKYSSRGSEEYIENYLLTRKVFEHLNDYDRDLVMLHWWFDNSFGEIALLYNMPKSTIQSQIERVERRGRKILGIK